MVLGAGQDLERDAAVELGVVGRVHLADAAATDQAEQAVAADRSRAVVRVAIA